MSDFAEPHRIGWARAALLRPFPIQLVMTVLFLVGWEWLSGVLHADFWISKPSEVLSALLAWYRSGDLGSDLRITLIEAGGGFLAGSVAGGPQRVESLHQTE